MKMGRGARRAPRRACGQPALEGQAMAKNRVVVVGTGDFARIARYYLEHDSALSVVAHSVSNALLDAKDFRGLPLVAFEDLPSTFPPDDHLLLIGIAYSRLNRNRREMFETAKRMGYEMVTYACSKAITWPDLSIGEGSFIFEANVIQPYVHIGKDTVIWSGNHIGHDSTIGDHVFMASHIVVSSSASTPRSATESRLDRTASSEPALWFSMTSAMAASSGAPPRSHCRSGAISCRKSNRSPHALHFGSRGRATRQC